MQIDLFERIKSVLIQKGWQYYRNGDIWTTEKTFGWITVKTFGGVVLTNDALISIMNSNSASSIGLFFTYILKKPAVLKSIFELLPDSFFDEGGRFQA